jgi:hypothetical protein
VKISTWWHIWVKFKCVAPKLGFFVQKFEPKTHYQFKVVLAGIDGDHQI